MDSDVIIDTLEHNILKTKDRLIALKFSNYVNSYIDAFNRLYNKENINRYKQDYNLVHRSTLQYYHSILNLAN